MTKLLVMPFDMPSKTAARKRKATKKLPTNLLFHAGSDDPDMYYFSKFHSSDPFLAFSVGKKRYGLAVPMEFNRMEMEGAFDEVLLYTDVRDAAAKRFKLGEGEVPNQVQIVKHLAKIYKIGEFLIGARFPAGLAFELRDAGVKLKVAGGRDFLPERLCKTAEEVEALRLGNVASAAGHKAVADVLRESTIKKGIVHHGGRPLTSEKLRDIISMATMSKGAVATGTIAAHGDQACDCHNAGEGPIPANQLIVCDIFPRRLDDGYWGDMTRTFLKGKASDAQKHLVKTVKKGHEIGMKMVKPGATGAQIQKAVADHFEKEGYQTIRNSKTPEGFFHAIGHGIGLEVHEGPVVRQDAKERLRKGMVITIEPGLYYRGLGGCRIEDVIHVTADGGEAISKAPYRWEIA